MHPGTSKGDTRDLCPDPTPLAAADGCLIGASSTVTLFLSAIEYTIKHVHVLCSYLDTKTNFDNE